MSKSREDEMREAAREFHLRNPDVWRLFVKFTFEKINAGFKNYSVRGVWHRIRWETPAGDDGVERFKLSNNHSRFYGEGFMKKYPQYDGFFRTRDAGSKEKPAGHRPEATPVNLKLV